MGLHQPGRQASKEARQSLIDRATPVLLSIDVPVADQMTDPRERRIYEAVNGKAKRAIAVTSDRNPIGLFRWASACVALLKVVLGHAASYDATPIAASVLSGVTAGRARRTVTLFYFDPSEAAGREQASNNERPKKVTETPRKLR